ncbi:unnamed protein product [Prorocentrum cordatum]|uniref:Uncharacterized protein n=1 Tax=Prorocentrum cordatum TaxID=2364126 RepID=A0ABN9YGW2_9DINO|nr:unnamed protein product [Polarella glacialis]
MRAWVAALLPAVSAAVLARRGRSVERRPLADPRAADDHGDDARNASKVMVLGRWMPSLPEAEIVATLRALFERAREPSRVYVGVVQQNSRGQQAALETPLAARLCSALAATPDLLDEPHGSHQFQGRQKDEDGWSPSEASYTPESLAACEPASRVRMYHVATRQAKGPADDRGLQHMRLSGSEELEDFCMQIDTDTVFTPGWDDKAIRQWTEMDNEYVVLSAVDSEDPMVTGQYVLPRPGNTASSWVQEAAERGSVPVIVPGNGHDGSCHTRWRSAFRDRLELVVQSSTHPVESDNELAEPPRLRLHVSSIGGVGTTSMMHELNRLNPPIATNHHSDLDRIKHIPFGDKIRKSAPDKILYIYGDPVHAVISLDRRGWFHHQAMKVRSDPWPTGLSKATGMTNLSQWLDDPGDDFLQLERHFGSFYHQCEFPVAFLLINEKTEHLDELAAFLETDKTQVARVLHEWKPERITADTHPEPSTLDYDGLKDRIAEKLKGIISKFKALPGFTTVIPGKDC